MKLRDLFFLAETMPFDEWRDLGVAVLDLELARIDIEEAQEKYAAAQTAVEMKKKQYGVGE